jgi:DNA-binding NarL/FixJ family response regulator
MIRILIVDDHDVVRQGIKQLLLHESGFDVSGEAANGKQALELLTSGVKTDVLLADVNMPEMDGLELAKAARENFDGLAVVLLSMHEDENIVQQAFKNGVTNYVSKTANIEELVFALKQASAGKSFVSSSLTHRLIKGTTVKPYTFAEDDNVKVEFSDREMDVLKLIADGFTNVEAANKLFTSRRTVEGHRQSMMDKTKSRNSLALVRFAMRHGLLD